MTKKELQHLFESFSSKRIAVVGDVMLDKYIFGKVERISPEAPVPVIDVSSQSFRLGGAANVAANIRSIGATALLFGVVGDDDDGAILASRLNGDGLSADFLVTEHSRPTTAKTRVIAQNHHIVRIDSETRKPISSATERAMFELLAEHVTSLDAIIFEDYNKGVLTTSLIKKILALAQKHRVPVTVDPKKDNFFEYKRATVFKPNLKEISDALGRKFSNTDADATLACQMLQKKIKAENIVLTRSEKGMTIYNGEAEHIPSLALEVADVSGAGDTVIATLTVGMTAGLDALTAAKLANVAAGVVCAEVGAVAVDKAKLFSACLNYFAKQPLTS
ncbi:MAG: D-glycero-beta-D-manno-heptose-7-phosphate kinase [Chloroherpetonaceae bacterium]|nr:D-glycero-beta-D-manno-heptose-7-phosphate kinase [Chloroherpetonaceae bacterium]MDW8437978.1 D-glycero-beta-D-manno-heptose-7-phosphate kinase [Chloroherpetonaceae bacterium]